MKVRQFSDVELFQMFTIDMGEALLGGMLSSLKDGGDMPTQKEYRDACKLVGTPLWTVTPKTRGDDKKLNEDALTPQEVARKRVKEQSARAERMAAMVTPQMAEAMANDDDYVPPEMGEGLAEQLEPPVWLGV